tara:strand:+ start:3851 stop:5089 length:1239 start_codon:yes stop_codon:yes gene_type:complete
MKFSPQQDNALLAVRDWYRNSDKQVFHFFGYAGTGKTTLAKHIAEGIEGEVLFAAYTGKAAHVLRQKGCLNASTIHSLIYHSRDKSKARLVDLQTALTDLLIDMRDMEQEFIDNHPKVRSLKADIEDEAVNSSQPMFILNKESVVRDAALVVIDECSMVDASMAQDLLSFGTPVLVLGDPAQLPPVKSVGYFTENVTPDIMLDEIHRQAEQSAVLRMATKVRLGEPLELGDWGDDCFVHPIGTKLGHEEILGYDQLLVGKNVTRHASNAKIRGLLKMNDPYPIVGDRLVCLRNNSELGLLNGAIFYATEIEGVMDGKVHMSVRPEDEQISIDVAALEQHFLGKGKELDQKYWLKADAQEFDFGYTLTVHKSQGSQWDSVCIFDESWGSKEQRQRWLYTAVTRAATRVTVIRM